MKSSPFPESPKRKKKSSTYLIDFAKKHKLSYQRDRVGNLLISKPATKGMEQMKRHYPAVAMSIWWERSMPKYQHDFDKDPIEAYIEDGWVKARGTTLGADDGIGIAASLAVLASDSIAHGPLECLFTIDEESGMTGALGLQPGFLKGSVLLNLDSEDEGEIFIGCAGGIDTVASYKYKKRRIKKKLDCHSGKGRRLAGRSFRR